MTTAFLFGLLYGSALTFFVIRANWHWSVKACAWVVGFVAWVLVSEGVMS